MSILSLYSPTCSSKARCRLMNRKKRGLNSFFKKGDQTDPANYRPSSLLPIPYELFTRLLPHRVRKVPEQARSVDPAGFREGFGCEDHTTSARLLCAMPESGGLRRIKASKTCRFRCWLQRTKVYPTRSSQTMSATSSRASVERDKETRSPRISSTQCWRRLWHVQQRSGNEKGGVLMSEAQDASCTT